MGPNTQLLTTNLSQYFWLPKIARLCTKVISKRFTRYGQYPQITAASLHFNLMVIVSFQIQSAGVQSWNPNNFGAHCISLYIKWSVYLNNSINTPISLFHVKTETPLLHMLSLFWWPKVMFLEGAAHSHLTGASVTQALGKRNKHRGDKWKQTI
jgi:hypothetical protein